MVTFSKKLRWLEPYLDIAKKMYPKKLKTLLKVYKIPATTKKKQQVHGICYEFADKTYTIGTYIKYQEIVFKEDHVSVNLKKLSTLDLLATFAHELAHIVAGFDHTVKHKRAENRIMGKFLTALAKDGYISEEDEDKNGYDRLKM